MKRFLTFLFTALIMSFTAVNATINNLEVDVEGTNADFYWQGDTTVSKVYELDLLESSEFGYICAGAWKSLAFDMGQGGWMWMSSDLLLAYGQNYADIEAAGAQATVVAAWKANWEAAVDTVGTDVTLKPGTYVVVIEGYDANYDQVTEEMVYEFFEIAEPVTTDAIITPETKEKSIKILNHKGELMIISNGKVYNQMGTRIQ